MPIFDLQLKRRLARGRDIAAGSRPRPRRIQAIEGKVRALRIGGTFGAAKTPIGLEQTLYPRKISDRATLGFADPGSSTNAIAASI